MTLSLDLRCRDTICAPATPTGRSALSIIRVSGPDALRIKESVFAPRRGHQQPFVATFGDIVDGSGKFLDEAVCVYFPDTRSFTGEPSFEISVHGNPVIAQTVLSLLQQSGCRPAGPGEFSLRAVLNGKMDLTQAESIADIIDAQSPEGVQVALRNLKGGLESALLPIRSVVLSALCEIEARLDFPDEGIGEKHKEKLVSDLRDAHHLLAELLSRSKRSSKLMQGFRIVLYGRPNVGKSTLLNALIGEDRSIVHETPGTTRDVVEVVWQVSDLPAVLVDVAGIRDDDAIHPVEAIGIERAKKEFERADLVLCLMDSSDLDAEALTLPETLTPTLTVLTKMDLLRPTSSRSTEKKIPLPPFSKREISQIEISNSLEPTSGKVFFPPLEKGVGGFNLSISAKTGQGISALIERIQELVANDLPDSSDVLLTRLRHVDLVKNATQSLSAAIESFAAGVSDECVAYELRDVGRSLDELLGKRLNEEVLDLIFSRFCIGK